MSKKASRVIVSNIVQTNSENGLATNGLTFTLTGSHVDHVFSNTIIRTIVSLVGSYAYEEQDIVVTENENTSIHNSDYMIRRISNMPIIYPYEIPEDFAERCVKLEEDYIMQPQDNLTDIELIEAKNKRKINQINNIHMNVEAKNTSNDIVAVTTNEKFTTFYKDGTIIKDFYPRELLLLYLNPEQNITFTAESSFNIPLYNNSFSSTSVASHKYIDEFTYSIHIESFRQMTEKRIIKEACNIIILKLEKFKNKIHKLLNAKKDVPNIEYKQVIEIPAENQTIGEVFAKHACKHNSANAIVCRVDHPDNTSLIIDYNVGGMTMSKITESVIDQLKKDYLTVANAF